MSIVPQVVDAIDIPVIAAGRLLTEGALRQHFVLGAKGVQMGTAECVQKNALYKKYKEQY